MGKYHWREVPQVSFLTRQKFLSSHKHFVVTNMCCDKTCLLTWQKYACHDNIMFVAAKNVVTNMCLLRQTCICCDKASIATSMRLSQRLLLQQTCKVSLPWQNVCCDKKMFAATKDLSRQAYFCHDKTLLLFFFSFFKLFVTTKMILVEASANDRERLCLEMLKVAD